MPELQKNFYQSLLLILLLGSLTACGGGSGTNSETTGSNLNQLVARTGPIVAVSVGETVILDGSRSYYSSSNPGVTSGPESLDFEWTFTHSPEGITDTLQNANTVNPSFIAEEEGHYIVQLVVSTNGLTSKRALQTIVASTDPNEPTGPFNHQGLSSNCVNCHTGELDTTANTAGGKIPGKNPTHSATSRQCQACHTPQGFSILPFVDHQEIFGNCSECHNNQLAIGKSDQHIDTNAECDDCHSTNSFLDLNLNGSFDHTGISRGCAQCHNGTISQGHPGTAIHSPAPPQMLADCIACHNTTSFVGGKPDHSVLPVEGQDCSVCHDGNPIIGPVAGHPDFTPEQECDTCHGVVTFNKGGVFNHGIVDSNALSCVTCHSGSSGIGATGAPSLTASGGSHPSNTSCELCHSTVAFTPANDGHIALTLTPAPNPTSTPTCESCHEGSIATGKTDSPHTHLTTTQDCILCHTVGGTFTTGVFDHNNPLNGGPIITGCDSCHDDDITIGKLANHFPTSPANEPCETCHYDAAWTPTIAFSGVTLEHSGITDGCESCHTGDFNAPGKSANHVPTLDIANTFPQPPTLQDCADCHNLAISKNFNTNAAFSHNGISTGCLNCHDGGFASIGAIEKPNDHIPASNDCQSCHNTSAFAPQTFDHSGISSGCEGCHQGAFFQTPLDVTKYKSSAHLPTTQDCYVCHATSGDFSTNASFSHDGITGNCSSCHDGTYSGIGARSKADHPTTHPTTTADCAACHNLIAPLNFAIAFVDHTDPAVLAERCDSCHDGVTTIGKVDDPTPPHPTTTDDCNVCHVAGGTFKPSIFSHIGIVENCESCHQGTGVNGITGKNDDPTPPHPSTTEDCSVCHTTTSFAGAQFDHSGINITATTPPVADPLCATCHNGSTAPGKIPPPGHVPTNQDCVVCHQTSGFVPAGFDHTGIVDNCSSCHDAGFATAKPLTHILTAQDCGVCHNTTTFVGAVFDHTGIVDGCSTCHDGTTAIGKHQDHLFTTFDCNLCHTTATFVGGSWVHDSTTAGQCDTCHSPAGGASPKPNGHLATAYQCDACHNTNAWAPVNFSHDPNGDYPGDHRRNYSCSTCHGNSIDPPFPWPFPAYQPDCAACHANDFDRKGDHIGGENGTVSQNRDCGGSGCHRITDKNFD